MPPICRDCRAPGSGRARSSSTRWRPATRIGPSSSGELYFEYHRGVYTSQARTKRGNRRGEQALHDAEFIACLGADYPRAELDRLWKLLLLQQFHDILPGSSIGLVYEDAERDLAAVEAGADALVPPGDTLVNTLGFARREVAGDAMVAAAPYGAARRIEARDEVHADGLTLENAHLRVRLAPRRLRSSRCCTRPRVVRRSRLPATASSSTRIDPVAYDAWDIDPSALETRRDFAPAASWRAHATPLRAEIVFEWPGLTQIVRLDAGSRRLEFHTTIDWHEEHTLLKVCFPLAVHARTATYEMPFGYAERPTHWSTSWDRARYEVPGHRFADLSEHGFGVALLNDSKYGWSCFGNELRLSLLRSSRDARSARRPAAATSSPTRSFRTWAAGARRESWARRRASTRRCARPLSPFPSHSSRSTIPTSCSTRSSAPRTTTRSRCGSTRRTARVALRASARRRAVRVGTAGDCARGRRRTRSRLEGEQVLVPYRPHEIITIKMAPA